MLQTGRIGALPLPPPQLENPSGALIEAVYTASDKDDTLAVYWRTQDFNKAGWP